MDALFSWQTLWYLILILYIPACIGLILVVLLQKGKGMGFAGAFGMGGGSDTIFGPRASKSLPQKLTYIMAGIFMTLAFVMSLLSGRIGTGVAPATVDEKATDYSNLGDLGTAVEPAPAAEGAAPGAAPEAPAAAPEAPAPAPVAEAPAAEQPAIEQPTTEPVAEIPPSVEAPAPAQTSPDQGTPPAVPVPPVTPSAPAPGAQ